MSNEKENYKIRANISEPLHFSAISNSASIALYFNRFRFKRNHFHFISSWTVGYNIGVMNSPAEYIKAWCNQTLIDRYNLDLGKDGLVTLLSTIVSIFLVGGCIGSLFAATLADKYGRLVWMSPWKIVSSNSSIHFFLILSCVSKGTLFICGIMFSIGAVLFFLCYIVSFVEILLIGRFIVGLSSGITTVS